MLNLLKFADSQVLAGMNSQTHSCDRLQPIRRWLNGLEIDNAALAHLICQIIPAQCPFAREIRLRDRTLFRIPPLCKLNPLYEEVVSLRFRALCYLASECNQDVRRYC
jgi:hypothetical protein